MKQTNYLLLKYFKIFEKNSKNNYNKDNDTKEDWCECLWI